MAQSESADDVCPWTNCYRSTQLLGGKVRFVLSTNGHIAALVNPPSNPKSSYLASEDTSLAPDEWQASATREQRPLEAAPGSYVRDS